MFEIRGKIICLKADSASRKGRSILGINLQFIDCGKIIVRTLAMVETFERHTAENLLSEILKTLDHFGIKPDQVYSITTDNGRNFLKAARLMKDQQLNSGNLSENESDNETEDEEADVEDIFMEDDNLDISDLELIDFSDDKPSECDIADDLVVVQEAHLVGVKCAAHDIQLSVYDVLKKSVANFLVKVRKLVKVLRTQPYISSFKADKSRNLPILDGETRWNSAHVMVQRVADEKTFILSLLSSERKKEYNEKFWQMVERFVAVTKPLYFLTKRIQQEDLVCGSMFLYWKECCLVLEEIKDPLANQLLDALKNRQNLWFDNPAFLAAMFVDPRLQDFDPPILSAEQKETAIQHLLTTWKYLRKIQGSPSTIEETTPSTSSGATNLSRVERLLSVSRLLKPPDSNDIEKRIRRIPLEMSLPLSIDVIDFWEKKKREDKELSDLALTALQMPCTQVSVERCFNGLGQVLTKSRMRLGALPLEQILFVKANNDGLESVYFQYDTKSDTQAVND